MRRVFISYSHKDKPILERLQVFLKPLQREGIIDAWDDTRINAGDDWREEISKALADSDVAILLVSADFLASEFIVNDELPALLAKAESEGTTILSVIVGHSRFRQTKSISRFQAINEPSKPLRDLSPTQRDKVYVNLSNRLEELQQEAQKKPPAVSGQGSVTIGPPVLGVTPIDIAEKKADVTWQRETIQESQTDEAGYPGYELELQVFKFSSSKYPDVSLITDFIRGKLLGTLLRYRLPRVDNRMKMHSEVRVGQAIIDIYNAHCLDPSVIGGVVSIHYTVWEYSSTAAHPNHDFMTFSFLIDPISLIGSLSDIFANSWEGLPVLQGLVRTELRSIFSKYGDKPDLSSIDSGTSEWRHFDKFVFKDEGVDILFPPYQIAAYVYGSNVVSLPYSLLAPLMAPQFVKALQLEKFIQSD
jgi:hypothetical protein